MRATILCFAALALAACAEEGGYSQAPLASIEIERRADAAGGVTYICSHTGEEAAMWTLRSGEKLDPLPTGRSCDYEAYKAWREGWGEEPAREPAYNSLTAWERRRAAAQAAAAEAAQ